jgi:hypothetical protein
MLLAVADPYVSQFALWFMAFIALFALMSLASLRRSEDAWRKTKQKLEDQIVGQQHDLIRARESAAAWRLETQRQFDAYRADTSKQLTETEQRAAGIQQHLNATMARSWKTEAELRQSLDRALQLATASPTGVETNAAPSASDALEPLQAALAASQQKAAALEQALTLQRFRSRRAVAKAKMRA